MCPSPLSFRVGNAVATLTEGLPVIAEDAGVEVAPEQRGVHHLPAADTVGRHR